MGCVDHLHAEPVRGYACLVVELKRGGDGAVDVVPCYVDDAGGEGGKGGEGVWVKVEVVGAAARTFVCDLEYC